MPSSVTLKNEVKVLTHNGFPGSQILLTVLTEAQKKGKSSRTKEQGQIAGDMTSSHIVRSTKL